MIEFELKSIIWYKVAIDTQPLQYTFLYRFWKEVLNFDSWVSLVKCLSCNVFDVIAHGILFVSLDDYNNNVTILLWFKKKLYLSWTMDDLIFYGSSNMLVFRW